MRRGVSVLTGLLVIVSVFCFSGRSESFEAPTGDEKKCGACHTLTKEEATDLLKTQVVEVREAPIKGLWAVEGVQEGRNFTVFVDFGKTSVVLIERIIAADKIGAPPEWKRVDLSRIPLDDAIVMGEAGAEKKVIVFDDPDCPYCRKLHGELKKILAKRSDVAFFIKLYPLPSHPGAYDKSRTILCERSLKVLDDALTGKVLPKPTCETPELDKNIELAESIGIRGTPAIIFPDGRLLPGYVEADVLLDLLDNPEGK